MYAILDHKIMVGHWSIFEQNGDWHRQIAKSLVRNVSGHADDHYLTHCTRRCFLIEAHHHVL